jgi:hypothetical protein
MRPPRALSFGRIYAPNSQLISARTLKSRPAVFPVDWMPELAFHAAVDEILA